MEFNYDNFFNEYSQKFVKIIQDELAESKYKFAPGYFGNAYSSGRKSQYSGTGNKIASGGLSDSVQAVYKGNGVVQIFMANYWRYVDQGRDAGKKIKRNKKSKTGKDYQQTDYTKRPPTSALLPWIQKRFGLSGDDAQSAAFAIATNIAKFGIKKTNFFENASIKMEEKISTDFPIEADNLIGDLFDKMLFPSR
jgi:hypothetical protein